MSRWCHRKPVPGPFSPTPIILRASPGVPIRRPIQSHSNDPPGMTAPTPSPLSTAQIFGDDPHRRLNVLTGEWVLVSPQRMKRPWQGQIEEISAEHRPAYDPKCYLCPGNERAGGHRNPQYTGPWAFDNDFAALRPGDSG